MLHCACISVSQLSTVYSVQALLTVRAKFAEPRYIFLSVYSTGPQVMTRVTGDEPFPRIRDPSVPARVHQNLQSSSNLLHCSYLLMNVASSASISTPTSASILLDADEVFPSNRSSSGSSWLHPAKHEYEIYVGHFRSVALAAVQNVLFLLRNASTSIL